MVKGERQMDQDFVAGVGRCVKLLHDVVDMGDSTAYEQSKDECEYIVLGCP